MTIRMFGVVSVLSAATLLLGACTGGSTPGATEAAIKTDISSSTPSAQNRTATETYKMHAESLQKLARPSQILSEVESDGSGKLPIREVPAGFDSVGFMVSCEGSSTWDIALSSGTKLGGSDCGDDSSVMSNISVLRTDLGAKEVQLELSKEVKAWATIFATNRP